MYGINQEKNIPAPLQYSYQEWDHYVAKLWYNLISSLHINPINTVVEVGPGGSSKIAILLFYLHFEGTVYLIEPYEPALTCAIKKYETLLPRAKIVPMPYFLSDASEKLPNHLDLVIAHHVLDDMLLASAHDPADLNNLFHWITKKELIIPDFFIQKWSSLSQDSQKLASKKQAVLETWTNFISKKNPKWTLISQYPSMVIADHPLTASLNTEASTILYKLQSILQANCLSNRTIQAILNQHENYNFPLIGQEVLNAKNWITLKGDVALSILKCNKCL